MIIVIAEDEPLVAERIERLTKEILKEKLTKILVKNSLPDAMDYIFEHPVDLLLLDLNLHGKDGFELLKHAVSGSFHTIIISAHTEKAIEAFEYGVLDFLGKPFTIERLEAALSRFENIDTKNKYPTKYIAVRKNGKLLLIEVDKITFVRGAGIYSEIILRDGTIELHDKSLNNLDTILPSNFQRIHRSYIVNIQSAKSFSSLGGSKYSLQLLNGEVLPVSRNKYKEVKKFLS
ncbi:LytR/AlgR family response regulator transcription factor [candidate division KSB1 bacterium]